MRTRQEYIYMVKSNVWIDKNYKEQIDKIFDGFNSFEVSAFLETHEFRDSEEQTEENTNDHDISLVDEISFDVFREHLDCYFSCRQE